MVDQAPREAGQYLFSGEIERWLRALGDEETARKVGEVRQNYRANPPQGLEIFRAVSWVCRDRNLRCRIKNSTSAPLVRTGAALSNCACKTAGADCCLG
jgi:hypothetical protein